MPLAAPDADVIVIGGGIIGCACACALARRGMDVLVVERDSVASGASGACDGHLAIQTKAPGLQAELARRSLALYEQLPEEFRTAAEYRRCGSLLIAQDPAEVDALEGLIATRRDAGIDARLVTGDEARELEPALGTHVLAAGHCPTDAQANPWRITLWFAQAARGSGTRFVRDSALGLEADDHQVHIRTSAREITGRWAVVATGAWTRELDGLRAAPCILPRRGEILVTERLPGLLRGLVLSTSYLAKKFGGTQTPAATLAAEQSLAGNVLLGGTRDYAGFDLTVGASGTRALVHEAIRALPSLAQAHIIRTFAGLRPATPDGLPLVGPVASAPRVIMAAGHEGDGITLAPVTAEMVAGHICDGKPPDTRLSADRPGLGNLPPKTPPDQTGETLQYAESDRA